MNKNPIIILCLALTACSTSGPIVRSPASDGMIHSSSGGVSYANVIRSKPVPMREYKDLVVVLGDDFSPPADEESQVNKLGFFTRVLGLNDLDRLVVSNNLQEKVRTLRTWKGLGDLYRAYKPYLVIHFKCVDDKGAIKYRLIVTNPDTLENEFVDEVEVHTAAEYATMGLLTLGAGMYESNRCSGPDEVVRYPLFNSMMRWIRENE